MVISLFVCLHGRVTAFRFFVSGVMGSNLLSADAKAYGSQATVGDDEREEPAGATS